MNNLDQTLEFALLLLLAFVFLREIFSLYRSIAASKWPKVRGKILYAGIQEDNDAEVRSWNPMIDYVYTVDGREYISDRFAFGFNPSFWFLANGVVKEYVSKPEVLVFYNPNHPGQAVLATGLKFFHVFDLVLLTGILWILVRELRLLS